MDLHPIFVHFPIAFLTLYGALELVRFKKVMEQPYWFYVKAVLAVSGALGALVAALTGAISSGWMIGGPRIFALHQIFALSTVVLGLAAATAYAFTWFRPNRYSGLMLKPRIIVSIAALILIAVTITGGLGGAMVYGTDFDPLMKPIFQLLGVY